MAADLMVNSMAMASDLASQYQMSGHNLNQSQHLAAALSELTKAQVNNFTFFLERGVRGAEAEAEAKLRKDINLEKCAIFGKISSAINRIVEETEQILKLFLRILSLN